MAYVSRNPSTGDLIAEYPTLNKADALGLVASVHEGWHVWRNTNLKLRTDILSRAAALFRERKQDLAQIMAAEMGKPQAEGQGEAEKCAWVCDYYAAEAEAMLAPQAVATDAAKSYVSYQPLGVILAIMPWNFPLWQVMRFAAPTLAAGNAFVLKHAPNVTGCALAVEQLLLDAGLPELVGRVLLAENDVVAEVIAHPHIAAVTLTGSTRAGKAVAATAGAHLKKTVLELGGSDPYVILADADLDHAAKVCVTSRMINGGQSCIAAKRLIVVKGAAEAFTKAVHDLMAAKTFGNPLAGTFDIGPLARPDLRDELHRQVTRSVEMGATCLLGGTLPTGAGAFYPPTLLTNVTPEMPAGQEELFGPAAAIMVAEDTQEALAMANQTPYGLGAAVFSADAAKAEHMAVHQLNAGACFVNDFVRSDPRLPFGGVRESGYGRELGAFGMHEFVNIKTIYVR